MLIGRIVKSNSHIEYIARITDRVDNNNPPAKEDFAFGTFVTIPIDTQTNIIGVICNSILLNPEYSAYGPRLSPQPDLMVFTPDYLDEKGVLVCITLVGWENKEDNTYFQEIPTWVIPANQEVNLMNVEELKAFHFGADGKVLALHYYPQILTGGGELAISLLKTVITKLTSLTDNENDQRNLGILRKTLNKQASAGIR